MELKEKTRLLASLGKKQGMIFNIQRYAIHDGPGIRTTVFLKGCPLRCFWCQNPESQQKQPEIFLNKEACTLCGLCVNACPNGAVALGAESATIDRDRCEGCGKCVSACKKGALSYEIMDLQKGLALSARACIQGKSVLYVSALVNIAGSCDCDSYPGPIICPDIGYLASTEIAAIDKASLDFINKAKPGVFEEVNGVDPSNQIRYIEEIGSPAAYNLKRL